MKRFALILTLALFILLTAGFPVTAQQPIPPWPSELIRTPGYQPTWQAPYNQPIPPTPGPTPTPWGRFAVVGISTVYVYMHPTVQSVLYTALAPGTRLVVQNGPAGWLQLVEGPFTNGYIQVRDVQRLG